MGEKLTLWAPIDVYGAFWRPGDEGNKFTGRVARDKKFLQLTTSPSYREGLDIPREFLGEEEKRIELLHGYTTVGPCSLLWVQPVQHAGLTDFKVDKAVTFLQYRVGLCVLDHLVPSPESEFFEGASFSYSGLAEWIPIVPQRSITNEGWTISQVRKRSVFDFCVLPIRTRLQLEILPMPSHQYTGEYESKHHPRLIVTPAEPKSIRWYLELGGRIENLFSLLLGVSIRLESVELIRGEKSGAVLRADRSKKQPIDRNIWVQCSASQLANSVAQWLSEPEEFGSLEGLVYGTIRQSALFVENEFLSLGQALESFHRLTDHTTITDAESFKSILGAIYAAIQSAGSAIRKRLEDSVVHANEPDFRFRIMALLSRISEDHRKKLLGDVEEFEKNLRQTRNYFTHVGTKKKKNVLTETSELFLFSQKLHALLRLLILIHIGLPENEVFEPVLHQARRYS